MFVIIMRQPYFVYGYTEQILIDVLNVTHAVHSQTNIYCTLCLRVFLITILLIPFHFVTLFSFFPRSNRICFQSKAYKFLHDRPSELIFHPA